MKDIEDLLSSLRDHGTIDSEGQFTVSLAEARRKLTQYHASDKARYLLSLVSAGTAAGASEIEIESSESDYKLVFSDAYIPEEDLLAAFEGKASSVDSVAAQDLVLGLQGAFKNRAFQVELRMQSITGRSYYWQMTEAGDESFPLAADGQNYFVVELSYRHNLKSKMVSLFQRLRGYGGMPPEAKLVDQYCDRSLIPIQINQNRVDRPLFLPTAHRYALIGELGSKTERKAGQIHFKTRSWKGALALEPGTVQIVIHGVAYCQIEATGLSGTVYADGLKRDISREKVAKDVSYGKLLDEIEGIRCALYEDLAKGMSSMAEYSLDRHRTEFVLLFLTRRLSSDAQQGVWNWMLGSVPRLRPELSARDFQPSVLGLMELFEELDEDPDSKLIILRKMLEYCSDEIRSPSSRLSKVLDTAYKLFRQRDPEQTLVLGYLLLGIGAVHQAQGRKKEGEKAWFQSLEVVWSGKDDRAQELIYLHMGHSVRHILGQVSLALLMYLDSLPKEGAEPLLEGFEGGR